MSGDVYSEGSLPYSQSHVEGSPGFLPALGARSESRLAVLWQRILLGSILIEIPLQLDTYLYHSADDAQFGAISGFNISLATICIVLLYAQWLPRLIVGSEKLRISKSLLAFLAITTASIMWAGDRNLVLCEVFLLIQAFLIYAYVANNVRTREDVKFVVAILALGVAFQGAMMGLTRIVGDDLEAGPLSFQIYSRSKRVTGSLGSPNVAASFLALTLPLCLCLLFATVSKSLRNLAALALIAGSCGLVLTMSRGGWVATGIAFLLCFIVAFRRQWMSPRSFGFVCVVLFLLTIAFLPLLKDRIFGEDHGSAESRFPLYRISAAMIGDYPQGVGANNWEAASHPYAGTSENRGEWFFTVHNKYLLIWVEVGLLGLLAFLLFLLSTVTTGWQTWRLNDKLLSPIALGCTAAIIGQMIHMTIDIFNSRIQVQMLWLMAGLVVAVGAMALNSEAQLDHDLTK